MKPWLRQRYIILDNFVRLEAMTCTNNQLSILNMLLASLLNVLPKTEREDTCLKICA